MNTQAHQLTEYEQARIYHDRLQDLLAYLANMPTKEAIAKLTLIEMILNSPATLEEHSGMGDK